MSTTDYVVTRRQGRLIEARVHHLGGREDADRYSESLAQEAARHTASSVLCADHRPVRIYAPAAAERLAELFSVMNRRLERVAILVAPTNATLILQLERIVREAKFANRRVFREPDLAIQHLRGGLDHAEVARAAAFLSEHGATT